MRVEDKLVGRKNDAEVKPVADEAIGVLRIALEPDFMSESGRAIAEGKDRIKAASSQMKRSRRNIVGDGTPYVSPKCKRSILPICSSISGSPQQLVFIGPMDTNSHRQNWQAECLRNVSPPLVYGLSTKTERMYVCGVIGHDCLASATPHGLCFRSIPSYPYIRPHTLAGKS